MRPTQIPGILLACGLALGLPASASVIYNNLTPNNQIAVASRSNGTGAFEIETADDFVLSDLTRIDSATFTGLVVPGLAGTPSIAQVVGEIYRVFPLDSDTVRMSHVPTRANSPSDTAFDSRDSAASQLTFVSSLLSQTFTASNSVQPGGIHPSPNQTTLGNGAITGQEVQITVNFLTPLILPAGHYFFIPQVAMTNNGNFYWLSASRPITGAGTTPINPDLQAWTRDQFLDPDWLRVGTDIVGGATPPTFNLAFALDGTAVPEPSPAQMLLCGLALAVLGTVRLRRTH